MSLRLERWMDREEMSDMEILVGHHTGGGAVYVGGGWSELCGGRQVETSWWFVVGV
jgi:hypothetical protein